MSEPFVYPVQVGWEEGQCANANLVYGLEVWVDKRIQ